MGMEEVLKSQIIEKKKSRFAVDLVRAGNGKLFISVNQITFLKLTQSKESRIRIRPSDLEEIIQALTRFQSEIVKYYPRKKALSEAQKIELINRYLNKGLEIEMLAVQFDCSVEEVKRLLISRKLVITSNKLSKYKPKQRFWRRRKRKNPE
jgi:hypothetical protein